MNQKLLKKVSLLLSILLICLTISFIVLISRNDYGLAYETDAGNILTSKKEVELGAGETKKFTTNLLPNGKYCVVETRGDLDTYLSIQVGNTIYEDDNSGVGLNACIGFKWDGSLTIRVRLKSSNQNGKIQLQFRTQQASLFGFDYGSGDINTKKDALNACEYLEDYNSLAYTDPSLYSDLFLGGMPTVGYSRLNSEIFLFSGHGGPGFVNYPSSKNFYVTDIEHMENCKLAVWSSCQSAYPDSFYEISMAEASVRAGARTSIGWKETIPASSSSTFIKRLFKKLAEGSNVGDACSYAKNGIVWVWDNARNYTIFGDKTTKINASSIKKSGIQVPMENEKINEIVGNNNDWIGYELGDGVYRYYKVINGLISNVFYDIDLCRNVIVNKNNVDYEYQKVLVPKYDNYATKSFSSNHFRGASLTNIDVYNVYCIISGEAVPIEIKYCEYVNSNISYIEVVCTNLNNGENIDYNKICEVTI